MAQLLTHHGLGLGSGSNCSEHHTIAVYLSNFSWSRVTGEKWRTQLGRLDAPCADVLQQSRESCYGNDHWWFWQMQFATWSVTPRILGSTCCFHYKKLRLIMMPASSTRHGSVTATSPTPSSWSPANISWMDPVTSGSYRNHNEWQGEIVLKRQKRVASRA